MTSVDNHYVKANVFQELQKLEQQTRRVEQKKNDEKKQELELRCLKRKVEKMVAKRDSLQKKLQRGPKAIVKKSLESGAGISPEEESCVKAIVQDATNKSVKDLHSLYRLTGTSIDAIEDNVLRWRFDTAYKGEFFESYYVEIKADPGQPSRALRHSLPPFIPIENLRERYLYRDVKGFIDAVHRYLIPFVMRREETLKMERKFDDNIDGGVSVSNSYDFINFRLTDVKYFEEPLDVRLVYDDLTDHVPERVAIAPAEGVEVSTGQQQLITQYTHQFSQRSISDVVEEIVSGVTDLSASSSQKP